MKIKEGFKLRTVGKEHIVTAEGLQLVDFNKLIALNSSATYLWTAVEGKEFDVQTLANLLTAKYDVSGRQALADATHIANSWFEAGIIEE